MMLYISSSEHGDEGAEVLLLARDSEAHVVAEPELLLGPLEKALELGMAQPRNGHDVPAPVVPHVYHKMPLGYVMREGIFVIPVLFFPETRTPLDDVLYGRGLRHALGYRFL